MRGRVLLLASLLAVGGCSSGDFPSNIKWTGTTYYAIVSKVDLQPADLANVGEVESVSQAPEAPLRGRTASALRGVDTGEALVMPLMAGRYVVFKAQPATPPSARLCWYLVDFPGTGCGGT